MTAATVIADPSGLRFAKSDSKAVGMRGGLMDKIRDNAPRIVGGLRLAGDVTSGFSLNPFMIGYAIFAVTARLILLTFGTKENQKKMAAERDKNKVTVDASKPLSGFLAKATHPRQYPMESSAAFSVVSEVFEGGYGIQQFAKGKTGFTPLVVAILATYAYLNIIFGKEKKKPAAEQSGKDKPLDFARSKSKAVGIGGRIREIAKNNPVLVSSMVQLGNSLGMLIGSVVEGLSPAYMISGAFFLASNIVQAAFVRKNEFNIEGTQQEPQEKGPWSPPAAGNAHQERLAKQRSDSMKPGVQPA